MDEKTGRVPEAEAEARSDNAGFYARYLDWMENFHIGTDGLPEPVEIRDGKGRLIARIVAHGDGEPE
jgi:hypothetical protein